MDGGDVSTGTVEYLVEALDAQEFARIDPAGFYIYNFPGSMETSSLFRPHTCIENGRIVEFEESANVFYHSREHNLILFELSDPQFWIRCMNRGRAGAHLS